MTSSHTDHNQTETDFMVRNIHIELDQAKDDERLKQAIIDARKYYSTGNLNLTVHVPQRSQDNPDEMAAQQLAIADLKRAGFTFGGHICNEQNEIAAILMRKRVPNGQGLDSLPHNGKHPPAPKL